MLLRQIRRPGSPALHDARLRAGRIAEVAPHLAAHAGEEILDAGGAVAIPGLWDQHVHVGQAAQGASRLDTSAMTSVDALLAAVRAELAARPAAAEGETLVGFGHRLVDLEGAPTVAALDAASRAPGGAAVPVVLIGGDAHHAWMSSAALAALGLPARTGIVAEDEWFDAAFHLEDLPGVAARLESGVVRLQEDALSRGIVGLTDMEWSENWRLWERRLPRLRVRTATYLSHLETAPGPTGTPIGTSGLVTMGPLKIIADGSLGSRSAFCRHAYAGAAASSISAGHGILSIDPDALRTAIARAEERGLEAAVHAIGDAAARIVLDAFAALPPRAGRRIEHAQLLTDEDIAGMARLGIAASVQPAHLLDDRDASVELWPGTFEESFRFRDLLRAGVPLLMGSDAPVAPIDPWLAMAAAVHRSADARQAWLPAQQLQPLEALMASVDGAPLLEAGATSDVVLLSDDPFAAVPTTPDGLMDEHAARESAARLREVRPLATILAGQVAFSR